ncbi:MAG: hypothetical protein R3F27_08295 [Gammaproteobacteria bacterium]
MRTTILTAAGLLLAAMAQAQHVHEPAAAAADEHDHEHAQAGAMVLNMRLDDGKKWPTDAPLRAGMAAIQAAFDADHAAIHAGTETDAQYAALAGRIEQEVQTIIARCQLPPAADANLHHAIADLSRGVALMRGEDPASSRHDGAALVHGALIAYAAYFDE